MNDWKELVEAVKRSSLEEQKAFIQLVLENTTRLAVKSLAELLGLKIYYNVEWNLDVFKQHFSVDWDGE